MRILQVAPLIAGFAGDSNQILLIAKKLQERGHEVSIVTTDADFFYFDKEKSIQYSTIRKKLLSAKNSKTDVMGITTYVAHCTNHQLGMYCPNAKILANRLLEEFDIIHICGWYHHLGIVFSNVAHKKNIPFVVSAWGSLQPNARKIKKNQKRFVDFLFTKKMIKNASGFHSVGDQETDVYLQLGAQKNNIYRIDHGINLDDFIIKTKTTIFEKLHIDPKSEQYIIFMSRIDKKKGLELLISSFNKINKKYPNLYLIIAGSGDENYKRELKKFVNDLQLNDKIKWAGLVSNEEKLELLKNALFFVLTSHSDVHPIAVQDALTMHIPVVITRACDYPEVETYNTGFLVDENIDEISDAFEQLLNDHKLRQTFSRNSQKLVSEKFSLDTKITQYEKMFENVIKNDLQN